MRTYQVNLDVADITRIMSALDDAEDTLLERGDIERYKDTVNLNVRLGRAMARQQELRGIK